MAPREGYWQGQVPKQAYTHQNYQQGRQLNGSETHAMIEVYNAIVRCWNDYHENPTSDTNEQELIKRVFGVVIEAGLGNQLYIAQQHGDWMVEIQPVRFKIYKPGFSMMRNDLTAPKVKYVVVHVKDEGKFGAFEQWLVAHKLVHT